MANKLQEPTVSRGGHIEDTIGSSLDGSLSDLGDVLILLIAFTLPVCKNYST
jgi:hypothetical protein